MLNNWKCTEWQITNHKLEFFDVLDLITVMVNICNPVDQAKISFSNNGFALVF